MEKKINFNKEMTKGQKLEKMAMTIKDIRNIQQDNDLQRSYIQTYWKKLWQYTKGEYFTISNSEYSEFVKITNEIYENQCKLEVILKKMVNTTLYNIDNV